MGSYLEFAALGEGKVRPQHKRYARALTALLTHQEIPREAMDRTIGASNSPDVLMRLGRRFGLGITCRQVESLDRDGLPCRPGRYSIDPASREQAKTVLRWMLSGGQDAGMNVLEGV